MEIHAIRWPEGARYVRVAVVDDGIPRDAVVRVLRPVRSGAPAVLHVRHRSSGDWWPLAFDVQVSPDGVSWIAADGPPQRRVA